MLRLQKEKQYREDNKEKIKEKDKKYRDNNKEEINKKGRENYELNKEKMKEKFTCLCGGTFRKDSKSKHEKTVKHCKFIQ